MRKVAARLIPVLLLLYVIAYLDRVNVTFAQDKLRGATSASRAPSTASAPGIFFIGYFFLEVPSNLALHRFGARKWMARIMITWGVISACTMFVQSAASFYAVRFLLGVAEAGFFPGMILYLSYWFPARERAKAVGFFMSAIAISYAIGAPISGGDHVRLRRRRRARPTGSGSSSSRRFRPSLAGVFVLFYLDDGPEHAAWLEDDEKRWLARRLESEERTRTRTERHSVGEALKDRRVLAFGLLYFCMVVNVYGLSFWVGEIVDNISGLSDVGKGFVTAIPYTVAIVGLVLISRHSDRTGERKRHRQRVPRRRGGRVRREHGRRPDRRDSPRSPSACSSCSARTRCSGRCRPRCSAAPRRRRASRSSTRSGTSAASSARTSSASSRTRPARPTAA